MNGKKQGLIYAGAVAFFFVLIPLIMLTITGFNPDDVVNSGFINMLHRSLLFSPILVVLGFLRCYYGDGDKRKLWCQIGFAAALILWFLFVTNFGQTMELFIVRKDLYVMNFDMPLMFTATAAAIAVFAIFRLIRIPLYYKQYKDADKDSGIQNGTEINNDNE